MKMKHLLLLVCCFAICTACAQTPTEQQAKVSVSELVQRESKGFIKVISLTKTNGQEMNLGGREMYIFHYDLLIEFTQDCFKACNLLNGCFYTYRDCTVQEPIGWEIWQGNKKVYQRATN